MQDWVSPCLGLRFDVSAVDLQVFRPDGKKCMTYVEIASQAEQERKRADQLADYLRSQGIDPDTIA